MTFRKHLRLVPAASLAACVVALGVLDGNRISAQQSAPAEESEAQDAESSEDRFAIPEGNAKKIHQFIRQLANAEPEGESEQEQAEFAEKLLQTMVKATDKLLAAKPSADQARFAYDYKIRALNLISQSGDPAAEKALAAAVEAARSDERSEVAGLGWQYTIQLKQNEWDNLSTSGRQEFKKMVLAAIAEGDVTRMDVSIASAVAGGFERIDEPFVAELLAEAVPVFQKSDDAKVKKALAQSNLEGLMRRMNLLGNPMEISGTWLDGTPVDWKSYRGKVVLVDFWATWCGPCRQELPNVLAMYKAYHDKGFDVIGVSLDDSPEDAEKYVAEMELPWSSIFPKEEKDRSWNHPLAQFYGISGIPTAILVGKDGKVVHLDARADALRDQLQQLLGDPASATDAAASSPGK